MMEEEKANWYFTFGANQKHEGRYCVFFGTKEETRKKMFDLFGRKWSMQYSKQQWELSDGRTLADEWGWKLLKT